MKGKSRKLALGLTVLLWPMAMFVSLLAAGIHVAIAALGTLTLVMLSHLALERLAPRRAVTPMSLLDHTRTMIHGFGYGLTLGAVAVVTAWALASRLHLAAGLPPLPLESPALRVAFVLVLGDLLDYVRHRVEHASDGPLWRLHAVHHSITELSSMRGARVHPTEPLLVYGCYGLVGGLFGVGLHDTVVAAVFAILVMTTQHINLDSDVGWLRYVVVYTDTHRWHHDRFRTPACNFANVFTVWDLLFKTHHQPHDFHGPVGLEPIGDRFPDALSAQLTLPFRAERWRELEGPPTGGAAP